MTTRQMRDSVHIQIDRLARFCKDIATVRDQFEEADVHLSIIAAIDEALGAVSTACNKLHHAETLLKQASC